MGTNGEMSRLTFEYDPINTGCRVVVSVIFKGKQNKRTDIRDGVLTNRLPVFRSQCPAAFFDRVALYGQKLSADNLRDIHEGLHRPGVRSVRIANMDFPIAYLSDHREFK